MQLLCGMDRLDEQGFTLHLQQLNIYTPTKRSQSETDLLYLLQL